MIISRTPFRISFFGGGTDYPAWYRENKGAVLATTINRYCYITCRYLPPFFEHKYRIVYSKIENVKDISEIMHPSARAVLQFMKIREGIELHHDGDLPARTGLGSSSAFTVGLLHALYALKGVMLPKNRLATQAIHIEQEILKENVGSQDQILAAFGGFNRINFNLDGSFQIMPVILKKEKLEQLQKHLMLYFTGLSRFASDIAAEQIKNIGERKRELSLMYQMVEEAIKILNSSTIEISEFGKLLNETWKLKRTLSSRISDPRINGIYEAACKNGALGGKLLGAGGGGFMIFFVKPEEQPRVKERLRNILQVPFQFENQGSQIIFYQPDV